jgi:hypothetical protein
MHQITLATHQNPSSNRTVSVRHQALYFQLQEHHCVDPEIPVSAGTDDFLDSDDILNGWFPNGITFMHFPVLLSFIRILLLLTAFMFPLGWC